MDPDLQVSLRELFPCLDSSVNCMIRFTLDLKGDADAAALPITAAWHFTAEVGSGACLPGVWKSFSDCICPASSGLLSVTGLWSRAHSSSLGKKKMHGSEGTALHVTGYSGTR